MICSVCKKKIIGRNFYYDEYSSTYLCSPACMKKYAQDRKEKDDKNKLWGLLCQVFNVEQLPSRILGEVARFHNSGGLSYSQIACIVNYMYNIKGMSTGYQSIWEVPHYKDEVRQYYLEKKKQQEIVNDFKEVEMPQKVILPNYNKIKRKNTFAIKPDEM